MRIPVLAWLVSLLASSCGSGTSAHPPILRQYEDGALERAARAVDQLRWYVDAYGGASMSSPALVQPDSAFKFSLSTTADQFFAAERDQISGRAAGAVASASVIGTSVSASVDLVAMQQYREALANYQQAQQAVARKQALQDTAAYRQYHAAMADAAKLTDPSARANAEAEARRQLAANLSGPSADATLSPPAPPAPPALPGVASVPNAAGDLLPALSPTQALYAAGTPGVTGDNRTALLMAAGDVATSAMLSTLLDPSKLASLSGRQVLWGVSMISVNPGWKTRRGYAADLDGHLEYSWTWARPEVRDAFLGQTSAKSGLEAHALTALQRCVVDSLPFPRPDLGVDQLDSCDARCKPAAPYDGIAYAPYVFKNKLGDAPVVVAASPMGDAQALDLQASSRSIREQALQMAFALTYAGLSVQASTFFEFAKSKQLDVETRTNNIVVSPHSTTDGTFGFRFNPRFTAAPGAGGSNDVLQIPTFPTLLVVGMNANELHPRVFISNGQCFVVEPRLVFQTNTRWTQTGSQCETAQAEDSPCHGKELTEEEMLQAAENVEAELARAREHWTGRKDHTIKSPNVYLDTLWRRKEQLLATLTGNGQSLWLPVDILVPPAAKPPKPAITLAVPDSIVLEYGEDGEIVPKHVDMTIAGSDLDQIDLSKVASPAPDLDVTAKLSDKKLVLSFTINRPGGYTFVLTAKDGTALATPPLRVQAPTALVINRRTKDKDGPRSDTITYTPGTPADVVKSEIEKNKVFPADVKVNVSGGLSTTTSKGH